MRMRLFLKTGRARYWGRSSRPGQQRTSRGKIWAQAVATEWLRQRWTAAVRHWSRGLHCVVYIGDKQNADAGLCYASHRHTRLT